MANAAGKGIETGDLRTADWSRFSALILSPGRAADPPRTALVGDARPGWRGSRSSATSSCSAASGPRSRPDAPFVAITGTNGKSTTTALIAHILREAGRDVQMGGNIGTAILSLEPPGRTASMSSSARRSRSTSRRRSNRPSAYCSTSRPIISTGTGRWRTTLPSRSGWLPGLRLRWLASTTIQPRDRPASDKTRRRNIPSVRMPRA